MPISAMFIGGALLCYTGAIWSERLMKRGLLPPMFTAMLVGFGCDLVGTALMATMVVSRNTHRSPHHLSIHGTFGVIALVIMFAHVLWAAKARRDERYARRFSRYSLGAWCLWMSAFLLGIPKFL